VCSPSQSRTSSKLRWHSLKFVPALLRKDCLFGSPFQGLSSGIFLTAPLLLTSLVLFVNNGNMVSVLAASTFLMLSRQDVLVGNGRQLEEAVRNAVPGQTITLKNGNWPDCSLKITQGGQSDRATTIRAQTPGGVHFQGRSSVTFAAPWVSLEGVTFQDGGLTKGSVVQFASDHCSVRDVAILDYNPADRDDATYWVLFKGSSNLVTRCLFRGKNNMHPVVGNALEGARHNSVTDSVFKDIPYISDANGREIFRIWGTGKDGTLGEDGAFFTIDHNYFDHADGEGQEVISLKSNRNTVTNNMIVATKGGITFRQGNFNLVANNFVFGDHIDRSYGIRVTGQNQVVLNNTIENCSYGIWLMAGERSGSEPVQYQQVRNLRCEGNTMIDNQKFGLSVAGEIASGQQKSANSLPPVQCVIKGNHITCEPNQPSVIGIDASLAKSLGLADNHVSGAAKLPPGLPGFVVGATPVVRVDERAVIEKFRSAVGPRWWR